MGPYITAGIIGALLGAFDKGGKRKKFAKGGKVDGEDLLKKYREVTEQGGYMNCELFCILMKDGRSFKKFDKLPYISVDMLQAGDVLQFGDEEIPRHFAIYLDGDTVLEVETWGGTPRKNTISDNLDYYEEISAVYRDSGSEFAKGGRTEPTQTLAVYPHWPNLEQSRYKDVRAIDNGYDLDKYLSQIKGWDGDPENGGTMMYDVPEEEYNRLKTIIEGVLPVRIRKFDPNVPDFLAKEEEEDELWDKARGQLKKMAPGLRQATKDLKDFVAKNPDASLDETKEFLKGKHPEMAGDIDRLIAQMAIVQVLDNYTEEQGLPKFKDGGRLSEFDAIERNDIIRSVYTTKGDVLREVRNNLGEIGMKIVEEDWDYGYGTNQTDYKIWIEPDNEISDAESMAIHRFFKKIDTNASTSNFGDSMEIRFSLDFAKGGTTPKSDHDRIQGLKKGDKIRITRLTDNRRTETPILLTLMRKGLVNKGKRNEKTKFRFEDEDGRTFFAYHVMGEPARFALDDSAIIVSDDIDFVPKMAKGGRIHGNKSLIGLTGEALADALSKELGVLVRPKGIDYTSYDPKTTLMDIYPDSPPEDKDSPYTDSSSLRCSQNIYLSVSPQSGSIQDVYIEAMDRVTIDLDYGVQSYSTRCAGMKSIDFRDNDKYRNATFPLRQIQGFIKEMQMERKRYGKAMADYYKNVQPTHWMD